MRERLIKLIINSVSGCARNWAETIADYLLENGVIVPPVKVGDIAYFIIKDEVSGERYIASQRINDVSTKGFFISTSTLEENCNDFEPYSEIGKTVFLTREEAEKALKGDVENE